jgi:DNA-binding transcriptional LysR family regulator
MTAPGNPIRDLVLVACEQAGFQPRIVHQSDVFRAVRSLVAAGAGVSFGSVLPCRLRLLRSSARCPGRRRRGVCTPPSPFVLDGELLLGNGDP